MAKELTQQQQSGIRNLMKSSASMGEGGGTIGDCIRAALLLTVSEYEELKESIEAFLLEYVSPPSANTGA